MLAQKIQLSTFDDPVHLFIAEKEQILEKMIGRERDVILLSCLFGYFKAVNAVVQHLFHCSNV